MIEFRFIAFFHPTCKMFLFWQVAFRQFKIFTRWVAVSVSSNADAPFPCRSGNLIMLSHAPHAQISEKHTSLSAEQNRLKVNFLSLKAVTRKDLCELTEKWIRKLISSFSCMWTIVIASFSAKLTLLVFNFIYVKLQRVFFHEKCLKNHLPDKRLFLMNVLHQNLLCQMSDEISPFCRRNCQLF